MKKKQIVGMLLAVSLIVVSLFLPENGVLTRPGIKTVGILIAFLMILVTEALPIVVTSILCCSLLPLIGVTEKFSDALSGFSQPIVFFTMASFGIAAAITATPLSTRILRGLLHIFHRSIQHVLLAVMICAAVVSSIVSNVPTCAIFMTIAIGILKLYSDEADARRSGRAFMIGVPVASMIGGIMTPAGSSINLLAITLLEEHTSQTVTFVQWMLAGVPLAMLMLPVAWFLIVKIYRPAPVSPERIKEFRDSLDIPAQIGKNETKVLIIVGLMFTLWILSSWVSQINVILVAMIGCVVMFLPGIRALDINTFLRENSWDAFFLVGAVLSLSNAMIQNGVSAAIAGAIPALNISLPIIIAFTAALIFTSLIIIPVATSLIPIMAIPLFSVAVSANVSPALVIMTAAICAGNCYLLPLDTVPLITFSKGYYSMTDMIKSTALMQLIMIVLVSIWIPISGHLSGMI